jgi:hypothetical protein
VANWLEVVTPGKMTGVVEAGAGAGVGVAVGLDGALGGGAVEATPTPPVPPPHAASKSDSADTLPNRKRSRVNIFASVGIRGRKLA